MIKNLSLEEAIEQAHLDYELRKKEILSKLTKIKRLSKIPVCKLWIEQTMEFINEKEV